MERTRTLVLTFTALFLVLASIIWYHNIGSYEKTLIVENQRDLLDEEAKEKIAFYTMNKAYYVKERKQITYTKGMFPLVFKKDMKILSSTYYSHSD